MSDAPTDASPATTSPGAPAALDLAARWADAPSSDDVRDITNLMQAYAVFTDYGRVADITSMFTPDAVWDGHEIGYGVAIGPQDIAATVASHYRPEKPMMHVPGPPLVVSQSADVAHAYSWCLAARFADGRTSPVIYFTYEDEIR